MVGCCVFLLLHHLSLLFCDLSSHCTIASCSTSLRSLVCLVVALPPSHLLSGWLLHPLSSCHRLSSVGTSASHCAVTSCHAPLRAIASCTSSLAGCCIASPHAATSHLPAPPPLILLLPLIVPWPPVPLVWLVVAPPLLTLPSTICQQLCLSLRSCLCSEEPVTMSARDDDRSQHFVAPLSFLSSLSLSLQCNCPTVIVSVTFVSHDYGCPCITLCWM
jgi:hypothetical protein